MAKNDDPFKPLRTVIQMMDAFTQWIFKSFDWFTHGDHGTGCFGMFLAAVIVTFLACYLGGFGPWSEGRLKSEREYNLRSIGK